MIKKFKSIFFDYNWSQFYFMIYIKIIKENKLIKKMKNLSIVTIFLVFLGVFAQEENK